MQILGLANHIMHLANVTNFSDVTKHQRRLDNFEEAAFDLVLPNFQFPRLHKLHIHQFNFTQSSSSAMKMQHFTEENQ